MSDHRVLLSSCLQGSRRGNGFQLNVFDYFVSCSQLSFHSLSALDPVYYFQALFLEVRWEG